MIYKIIAKTLANRLKKVLDSVISPTQSVFVTGRIISDNAVIGFECIHTLNNKRSVKEGVAPLKLDMFKAYDKVEWSYLRKVMEKIGFCDQWISLIMQCVESVGFSILIHGKDGPNIHASERASSRSLYPFIFSFMCGGSVCSSQLGRT